MPALDRLEPSQLEPGVIDQLQQVLDDGPCLIGRENFKLPLPDPIFHLLLAVVNAMRNGETILLIPEEEFFTTKAAADFLGVSRPFLVNLLNQEKIPYHKVGSHRKIKLLDLKTYRDGRDKDRRVRLKKLFDKVQQAGHYDDVEGPEND
ncbi:MAG: excisionase family DNA-binding protein [Fimbriimonadaceae bacterium]